MVIYVHTNVLGTHVFDKDFKLLKRLDTEITDIMEWLDTEKSIITKYPKEEIFYIGVKNEKLTGIKLTQDPKKIDKLTEYFSKNIKDFFKPNLILTKKAVRESVNDDLFIIHAVNNIDELDKSANMLSKRLREWYELYFPEFSRSVGDNEAFAKLIVEKKKSELMVEIKQKEEESMGTDISKDNLQPMLNLAKKISSLYDLRKQHETYLEKIMSKYCPNLQAIAGTVTGAKLLALSGSLKKMVLFPASTIQLLGAEKALFRHMKTGSRSPKYGILINHPIVSKARKNDKGKAARSIADKISIGVKVDYYKGEFIGDKLRKQIENKFSK